MPVDPSKIQFVDALPVAPGDSTEQLEAETEMVAALALRMGVVLAPARLNLEGGAWVQVDGLAEDHSVLCEANAHQGELKRSQANKVLADAFKLTFLARRWPAARLVLLFSDETAARKFRPESKSWHALAVASFGMKVEVVDIRQELRGRVREAQVRQSR